MVRRQREPSTSEDEIVIGNFLMNVFFSMQTEIDNLNTAYFRCIAAKETEAA